MRGRGCVTISHERAQKVAIDRRERGYAAWTELERIGGIWPKPIDPPEHWQSGFWDGMGEYDAQDVQEVIRVASANFNAAQSWPWVARATFNYQSDRVTAETLKHSQSDANELVSSLAKRARGLAKALMEIDELLFQPVGVVGESHREKTLQVSIAIDQLLGGATTVHSLSTGKAALQFKLWAIADVCDAHGKHVGTGRRRGLQDPHLRLLVLRLASYWISVTDRPPSASNPFRSDGKDGPFVRLVDGCAKIGGGQGAGRKQVAIILKTIP